VVGAAASAVLAAAISAAAGQAGAGSLVIRDWSLEISMLS